jgi:hypothetical protein
MAPDGDDRDRLPKDLDRADGVAIAAYRWALVALVALVGWVLVGLLGNIPEGFGTQGEWFYVTIVLASFAAWIIGQLVMLARRQRRLSAAPPVRMESRNVGAHGHRFTVSLGDEPAAEASGQWTFSWSGDTSSPEPEDRLDDEATARATVLCSVGHDLDDVCRAMNPRYAGWGAERQGRYRDYVQMMIAARRP